MLTFINWQLLKHRLHLSRDVRWYDKGSGLTGFYGDLPPEGFWERLDWWL
jgi:hypothetical protein